MAQLLASLHDDEGRVTLPGFYDKVRPLSDRERELMSRVPFDEQAWLAGPAAGSAAHGEAGFSTLERTGARPTAEVNGMWGGYQGPGHKTIVPAEAHAKISFRLVADQDPADVADQVRAWVGRRLPEGITADVRAGKAGVAPCASDLDSPGMAALRRALFQIAHQPFLRPMGTGAQEIRKFPGLQPTAVDRRGREAAGVAAPVDSAVATPELLNSCEVEW